LFAAVVRLLEGMRVPACLLVVQMRKSLKISRSVVVYKFEDYCREKFGDYFWVGNPQMIGWH
jgi:hypothetical protein